MGSESFGQLVREIRAANNLSQRDMADRLGIAGTYQSDIEMGRRPTPNKRYLDALLSMCSTDRNTRRKLLLAWTRDRLSTAVFGFHIEHLTERQISGIARVLFPGHLTKEGRADG